MSILRFVNTYITTPTDFVQRKKTDKNNQHISVYPQAIFETLLIKNPNYFLYHFHKTNLFGEYMAVQPLLI